MEDENKKIRVVFFTHYTSMYGANRSLLELIRALKKLQVDSIVITPELGAINDVLNDEGVLNKSFHYYGWMECINNNISIVNVMKRYIKQLFSYISEIRITSWLKSLNVDILHTNSSVINIGACVAERLDKKHIWHIREYGQDDYNIQYIIPINEAVKFIENKSEKIVFISNDLLSVYRKYLNKSSKITMIHNGVENGKYYCERSKESFGGKLKIIMCGLIHPNKNQLEVIKAICLLNKDIRERIEMHLIGDGDQNYISLLREYVEEKDMGSIFYFHGYMNDVSKFIKSCHIAVVPSKREAFGRVTVEYMLSGIGVIVSNTGANPEIIEDNVTGLIYKLNDEVMLSEKIAIYITNREILYSCAMNGQKKALEHFTSDINAENINQLYRDITN